MGLNDVMIHKQSFALSDILKMRVPIGSRLIDAAEDYMQRGWIAIWYERPVAVPGEQTVNLFIVGTGMPFDIKNKYVLYFKTVHMSDGFVWHIYYSDR